MSRGYVVAGAGVALAGADKLIGERAYEGMFRQLGWSQAQMRRLGAAEVLGGVLMIPRGSRRLGAAIVCAASATVLLAEIGRGRTRLAASRGGVLLAALAALAAPGV